MLKRAVIVRSRQGLGAALAIAILASLGAPVVWARQGDDVPEQKSLLGSYLAGRVARGQHDAAAAAEYYKAALARDPGNMALAEQSLLMEATEGHFEQAIPLARSIVEQQKDHRMSRLVLGLAAARDKRYGEALEQFKAPGNGVMEQLTLALSRAWMKIGLGDTAGAMADADAINQAEWARFYVRYHKALMYDVAGNRAEAQAAYDRIFRADSKSFRVALAYAHHASAMGDNKLAIATLEDHAKKTGGTLHPVARRLIERLQSGENVGLLIASPGEGEAEVFYGLGEALASEGGIGVGAVYLQMALYLEPKSPFALAALANVYESSKDYTAAIAAYDRIPPGSPLEEAVDLRKAQNLTLLDRIDDAKALLEKLAGRNPNDIKAYDALGTMMRGKKRYEEAIGYYTKAISLLDKADAKYWPYYYARGTSYERVKNWPAAEADLQKALQLSPDQPLVLNYLGYSWVDQGLNLQKGLKLIEKAVQLKPDDGYIVDSLGWAQFRLGNYKQAVKHLDRAVELRPEDPTLNDHLGDAFWRVGRKREAEFQWSQALSLKPEADDAVKIRQKLEHGLPEPTPAKAQKAKRTKSVASPPARKRIETRLNSRPQVQ